MHPLDRPVWASLTTAHTHLSTGGDLARRYLPGVNRFVSACDDSDAALAALADLVQPSDPAYILQVPAISIPPGFIVRMDVGVQMVAPGPIEAESDDDDVVVLHDSDAGEMLALATLTRPGPFLRQTHRMGRFVGIRIGGRLAAMAGERFRLPGYTEVSGVCTHPDFRGRGLARRLSRHVASRIASRGETAFLHAWSSNTPAIALYAALGFHLRCEVNVAVLEHNPIPD